MSPNPLGDAKKDFALFARGATLMARIGKIKVNMAHMRNKRERVMGSIGVIVYGMYETERTLNGDLLAQRLRSDLDELQLLDVELQNSEAEIVKLQAEFKQGNAKPEGQ